MDLLIKLTIKRILKNSSLCAQGTTLYREPLCNYENQILNLEGKINELENRYVFIKIHPTDNIFLNL